MKNKTLKLGLIAAVGCWCGAVCALDESTYDWYFGDKLPLEGNGFTVVDETDRYLRIPKRNWQKAPKSVLGAARHSTGMLVRFRSDARRLAVKWQLKKGMIVDPLIPPAGMQGLDVYELVREGEWRFRGNKRYQLSGFKAPTNGVAAAEFSWTPGKTGLVYLPTRGEIVDFRVGVEKGKSFAFAPHAKGHEKPVVHYGTSIVHGGCASRPGLTFTAICGRLIDRPYVNLGFSGVGRMEIEMADILAETDAELYVVDCVWNMGRDKGALIRERTIPFLKRLHELRPETPILLCEGCNSGEKRLASNDVLKAEYEKLLAADSSATRWLNYFPEEEMLIRGDYEQTHDFCHPNDHGSLILGPAYARRIDRILGGKEIEQ